MNNFYGQYFGQTQPEPITPEQAWQRHNEYLRNLANSPRVDDLITRFNVPEIKEAEAELREVIARIDDPALQFDVDAAAGKLASAYQILGFCAGHFSQDSRAQMI